MSCLEFQNQNKFQWWCVFLKPVKLVCISMLLKLMHILKLNWFLLLDVVLQSLNLIYSGINVEREMVRHRCVPDYAWLVGGLTVKKDNIIWLIEITRQKSIKGALYSRRSLSPHPSPPYFPHFFSLPLPLHPPPSWSWLLHRPGWWHDQSSDL